MSGTELSRRRRATRVLSTLGAVAVLVLAGATGLLYSRSNPPPQHQRQSTHNLQSRPKSSRHWNVAAQDALAGRPMMQLPVQAAMPQALSAKSAGEPVTLPRPSLTSGRWIPAGFPMTPQGALARLVAIDEAALAGADPAVVVRAYRAVSLPGAPDPRLSTAYTTADDLREHAGLPDSGPVPGLSADYEVTHGLIKGTTDDGRFAVVCVLGRLSVQFQGTTAKAGLGDCQALRYVDGAWRISPTARPATAPSAWPGSAESVRAGYRELRYA